LELNGYEQRPIAALIKSCVEILIKLQGFFWPSKGKGTQKRNCKTTTKNSAERTK